MLWKQKVAVLIVYSVISCINAKNSYIAMFPKTIRPNIETDINVQILESTGPVLVDVSLEDNNNVSISSNSLLIEKAADGSQSATIPLVIPSTLISGKYAIRITGSQGAKFSNWTTVEYKPKSSSILVQTDKAIYKPGQTINFRVMGINPDLTMVKQPFNIGIYDPKGNKIAQFNNAEHPSGVYTDYLTMSDHPVLGIWKIKVTQGFEKYEKIFEVDEYVLPKFEVSIIFGKPFHLTSNSVLKGKIKATYTFGKPVKGKGKLRVNSKYSPNNKLERDFDIDGEYEFEIRTSDFKSMTRYLDGSTFLFSANVTEGVSGVRLNGSEEIRVYDLESQVKFLELPNNFKPGLQYTAAVKVSDRDDKPLANPMSRLNVTVTYNIPIEPKTTTPKPTPLPPLEGKVRPILEPMIIEHDIMGPWRPRPPTESVVKNLPVMDIPADGIVLFDLDILPRTSSVSIEARYEKNTAYKSLVPMKSPSDNFVQVKLKGDNPKAGLPSTFEIKSTEPVEKVSYQILAKGQIVKTGTVNMVGQKTTFVLPITFDMTPMSRLNVFYIRPDGEVVTDAITFNVDGIFKNKVSLDFDRRQVEPGKEVVLSLKADPDSLVNVLAVDKSVLLLKSGNDLSEDEIASQLDEYDTMPSRGGGGGPFPIFWGWRWPRPIGGEDAEDIFRNNGIVVLTDANVYNFVEPLRPMPMFRRQFNVMARGMPMMAMAAPSMVQDSPPVEMDMMGSIPPGPKPAPQVRKLFPETWLWTNDTLGASGEMTMSVKVPDTITSWVATAFAVNQNTGLGLSPSPANLEVFMPFFISLQLPYSVVRGEEVILQANVFNYLPYETEVLIILEKNMGWNNTVTLYKDNVLIKEKFPARIGRRFTIPAGGVAPAYFPVEPIETGELIVNMSSWTGTGVSDGVIKYLKVEPEGTEKEFNQPVLISLGTPQNPENNGVQTEDIDISFPPNTVKGSRRIRASVIGDLMGPSINGIENLLKMPYGCGEQNMLNFAPNIFVQKYLAATNKLTPTLESKIREYTMKGYQREMTYQHQNSGGFSAFGDSDKSATTWLTSFVIKSFAQASTFVTIDHDAVVRAVGWVVEQQDADGSFLEPGRVLHKEMQGGSAAGKRSLTAFVLVALQEALIMDGVKDIAQDAINKATRYLEGEFQKASDNVYELALLGYALETVKSPKVDDILRMLETKATIKDGTKYWIKPVVPESKWKRWTPVKDRSKAVDIETTSYVLLIYALRKDKVNAIPILKWVAAQRNPEGGFVSTQDTIVALQSLSEIAGELYSKIFNMRVRLSNVGSGAPFEHEFQVTPENALVLQTVQVPTDVSKLRVIAEGTGIALVEVATYFNIEEDLQTAAFDANVTLLDESKRGFTVKVCTRWLKKGNAGMSMMDIGIPSGMQPDISSLDTTKAPMYKRQEMGFRKLSIYLDEIDAQPQCVSVYMQTTDMVGEKQPSVIRIYDYYEPDNQVTTFYQSGLLSKAGVCDVCGRECFCPDLMP